MASIALSVIRCIDYLGYGTLFTRAMFRPKKKLEVFLDFFSRQKSPRCSPGGGGGAGEEAWVNSAGKGRSGIVPTSFHSTDNTS
jgi:hypothetical protein